MEVKLLYEKNCVTATACLSNNEKSINKNLVPFVCAFYFAIQMRSEKASGKKAESSPIVATCMYVCVSLLAL